MTSSQVDGPSVEECPLCTAVAGASPSEIAYEDDCWIALALLDVPGWLRVMTKRHAEGCWNLSTDEAAGMGGVLQAVSQAVRSVTGAERVHTISLGEGAAHYHYAMLPRLPGEVPLFTGAPLASRAAEVADPTRTSELTAEIRAVLTLTGGR